MIKVKKYSGKMAVDLSDIDGLIYRLQNAKEETMHELLKMSKEWGADVEGVYKSGISYANGFKSHPSHRNKGTFFDVEFSKDSENNIRIVVGHASFIARFLEVGTTAHVVTPTIRGTKRAIEVSGITGSKALSKAFTSERQELGRMLETTVNRLLSQK